MKIAVCPGHHVDRQGAANRKYPWTEWTAMTHIVFHLAGRLEEAGHEVSIIEGRLPQKVAHINEGKFDLAFDCHLNADNDHVDPLDKDDTRGAGTMVMVVPGNKKRMEQGNVMAETISMMLGTRNHGAREGWYWGGDRPGTKPDYFLSRTNCPAFIPEPFYIDNNAECEYWLERGRQNQVADALAMGIQDMIKVFRFGGG